MTCQSNACDLDDSCNQNLLSDSEPVGYLLYLFLHFNDFKVAALLDSGSTTNLMSFSLYSHCHNQLNLLCDHYHLTN